jgi:hypothetical protein
MGSQDTRKAVSFEHSVGNEALKGPPDSPSEIVATIFIAVDGLPQWVTEASCEVGNDS